MNESSGDEEGDTRRKAKQKRMERPKNSEIVMRKMGLGDHCNSDEYADCITRLNILGRLVRCSLLDIFKWDRDGVIEFFKAKVYKNSFAPYCRGIQLHYIDPTRGGRTGSRSLNYVLLWCESRVSWYDGHFDWLYGSTVLHRIYELHLCAFLSSHPKILISCEQVWWCECR